MKIFSLKSRKFILRTKGSVNSGSIRPDSNAETPQSLVQSKAGKGTEISNSYQQFVIEYSEVLCSHPLKEEPRYSERFS